MLKRAHNVFLFTLCTVLAFETTPIYLRAQPRGGFLSLRLSSATVSLRADKDSQLKLSELLNKSRVTFTNYVRLEQWCSTRAVHQQCVSEDRRALTAKVRGGKWTFYLSF